MKPREWVAIIAAVLMMASLFHRANDYNEKDPVTWKHH